MMRSSFLIWLVLFVLTALTAGCGGGGSGTAPTAQQGTLGVSITDSPACGFDEVNVTVEKVRVNQSDTADEDSSGWYDLTLNSARKINLLSLMNGALEELGLIPLPAGGYSQLRLVLAANAGAATDNSVVLTGTTEELPLQTPSAVQTGIKLINEFDVALGQRVDLVLDFDACKSVVPRGNGSYALKPVVRVIPSAVNGIDGFVDVSLLGSNVIVSAQADGAVIRSTTPNPLTGEFFLARLDPGDYDVVIVADGRSAAVVAGIPIAGLADVVTISTSAAPFLLAVSAEKMISGSVTLNPVSATEAVYVAGKQTFAAGPTVTIKTRAADLLSGGYSLTLPIGAPVLGSYGSGALPISFSAEPAIAGKYAVEAYANGYLTQTFSEDISLANVLLDFILTL